MAAHTLTAIEGGANTTPCCDPVIAAEFLAHTLSELAHWRRPENLIDELMEGFVIHGIWQRWAQRNGYDETREPDLDEIVAQVLVANEKRQAMASAGSRTGLRLVVSNGERVIP